MRHYKPNLYMLKPCEIDTSTTADVVYQRYANDSEIAIDQNQYIEKIDSSGATVTQTWTWGLWTDRATITDWVAMSQRYID